MRLIIGIIVWFFLPSVLSLPIDLFNTDAVRMPISRESVGPGICKENINNDNITNTKWWRYDNLTHKCWHIDERQPCGKLMLFYGIGDSDFGACDCNLYYLLSCARPIIYWPNGQRCYYTNDQGPCKSHEWLVLDENLKATCQLNPCKSNQTVDPSTYDRYWFEKDGICYKTLTQGYCTNPQEILYPKFNEILPSCNIGRVCNSRNVRESNRLHMKNQCIPGQKIDQEGHCRPVYRVTNWFQYAIFKR